MIYVPNEYADRAEAERSDHNLHPGAHLVTRFFFCGRANWSIEVKSKEKFCRAESINYERD